MILNGDDLEIVSITKRLLLRAGNELSNEPINTRYMRDMQGELRELATRTTDHQITFLLFFIPLFIDDIYYNLVGDIVGINWEILEKVRQDTFRKLGNSLIEIANVLDKGKFDKLYPIYGTLVAYYVSNVNYLNTLSAKDLNNTFGDLNISENEI